MAETVEVLRAYRYALDPTDDQQQDLARHAGAARWAFNHALDAKVAAHELWRERVAELVATGTPEPLARRQVKVPVPRKPEIQRALNAVKGDDRKGKEGACPWWHTVSTYAFQSAMEDADAAWKNWLTSLPGRRAGRRVGYPRFKKRGRCRDSFRLHHDVRQPTIRPVTSRRLQLPRIGRVRVHGGMRKLLAALRRRDGVVQSVTVAREGNRWYAAVLVREQVPAPVPTRAMRDGGTIGAHLGVPNLATLSTGETFPNPKVKQRHALKLAWANRVHARRVKASPDGSRRREKARRELARLHHLEAERRKTGLHRVSRAVASRFERVVVLGTDYQVAARRRPGRTAVSRALADASLGELRRQIAYKTSWQGGELVVADRSARPGEACSGCGAKTKPRAPGGSFKCAECDLKIGYALNVARNLRSLYVAPDRGETLNARGAAVRPVPPGDRQGGQAAVKREDPPDEGGPPRGSDAPASPPDP